MLERAIASRSGGEDQLGPELRALYGKREEGGYWLFLKRAGWSGVSLLGTIARDPFGKGWSAIHGRFAHDVDMAEYPTHGRTRRECARAVAKRMYDNGVEDWVVSPA